MPADRFLIVSQFTFMAIAARAGVRALTRRLPPSRPRLSIIISWRNCALGPVPVETGVFQAMMEVHLVNQGPVTILMDTADRNKK